MKIIGVILLSLLATISKADTFDISSFRDANQLIWNEKFTAHINDFFSDQKESYFWEDAKISDQVISGFSGIPEDVIELDTGIFFTSACRDNSCPEKSAYITDGKEELFGIISYLCPTKKGTFYCDQGQIVIFYENKNALELLSKYLKKWGISEAESAALVNKKR